MNSIKSVFSIKDLENLSGIKAHTIRIWEKRYQLLEPMRTDTNIRFYDIKNLQKLLNITLLHDYGYKISRISELPEEGIPALVQEITSDKSVKHHAISCFKMAMMNFNQELFTNTYNGLLSTKSFREVFQDIFIPLLGEIGMLWQSDTISPAHEHFISYLIKQKIIWNTEAIQSAKPINTDKVFILFLPLNEIHELGLMYLNYEMILHGYKTVFLGESVDYSNLKILKGYFSNIVYVSNLTVEPHRNELQQYLDRFSEQLLDETTQLWLTGRLIRNITTEDLAKAIRIYNSIPELIKNL